MVEYNLRPIWTQLLVIHAGIREVCKKHSLRYWATGGTILGAIRHKGFIPWDDDFDLMMPRPDYERFWKVAVKDLPPNLKWKSVETTVDYQLPFGKVFDVDEETVSRIKRETNLKIDQGLFVDIFPIDGQPSTKNGLLLYKGVRAILRRVSFLSVLFQKFLSLYDYDAHDYIGVSFADSWRQHRCWWPKSWFDTTVELPFEDTTVPVPGKYMEFIANHYINWQELPPESSRCPTHQRLDGKLLNA